MKYKSIMIVSLIFMSGCASTQEAMDRARSKYVGENIDQFVLENGIPYRKHQLNNGDFIYLWNSGVISYKLPATTSYSGTASPYGFSGTSTTTGGGSLNVYCEVQIHTQENGQILSIKPVRDTIGKWRISRCIEILK